MLRAGAFYAAASWLLVQVATQVLPFFHIQEWIVRWIVVAAIIGLPFCLAFSWFYEFTPKGLERERDLPDHAATTRASNKSFDRWIIAILSLCLVILLATLVVPGARVTKQSGTGAAGAKIVSLAVLPLVNDMADPDQQYFSDGISEELITALSGVPDLKVTSRSSSFRFRGKDQDDFAGIGTTLGVQALLEGTVRQQGDRVRITASLVRSDDGSQVWSQVFERELHDPFAVQTEIATAVAKALKASLLGAIAASNDKPPGGDLAAYDALLQANFLLDRGEREDLRKAIGLYNEAIRIDKNYAFAYAKLATAWSVLASRYLAGQEAIDARSEQRTAAQAALSRAPDLALAHVVAGKVLTDVDFDPAAAERELRKAVAMAPNDPDAKNALGQLMGCLGQFDEAVDLLRQALAIDPLHTGWHADLAALLFARGDLSEAERSIGIEIAARPSAEGHRALLACIEVLQNRPKPALDSAGKEVAPDWRRFAMAVAQQAAGDRTAADASLDAVLQNDADHAPFRIALVYAYRNEVDTLFTWLTRAYDARDPALTGLLREPFLHAFRNDPRFVDLCKKIGLPTLR